jgi:N-acetylmuramoyl-L-alanine amidase
MKILGAARLAAWTGLFALASSAAPAADRAGARVVADASDGATRVVVTFPGKVKCETRAAAGRIEVACAEPIAFEPADGRVDDGILAGWRTDGDRVLVLATGPGFKSYDVFDLKNPPRLVVDVQGTRRASSSAAPPAVRVPGGRVIVLDPGHGGAEKGAVGPTGLEEKAVTLDLARRLEALLERDGATVILTRDDDRLVPLDDRTAIANHNKAELFVSIHLNASRGAKALGAETYFLSTEATDDEARTLAALENKSYEDPGAAGRAPGGTIDPALELILWDLAQNRYLNESSRLAEAVQREMNALVGTRDRGVRQAPFRVLMGATMPAILVEVGFISTPDEEARIKDDAYKDRIAQALARAIAGFRASERGPRP